MADVTEEEIMSMSDEEFEALQGSSDELAEESVVSENSDNIEETEVTADIPEEEETITEAPIEAEEEPSTDVPQETAPTGEGEETFQEEGDAGTEESLDADFDYKTTFNELIKPLKVSGREVQVKSIDDARNLMSMGMDYSNKMRDIKPLRALRETLKQAGIVSDDGTIREDDLALLIDINNGNKDALVKLMKDKNIDPLDLDSTEENVYVPQAQIVSEGAVELQEVEQTLNARGTLPTVLEKLNILDPQSKQYFATKPDDLLKLEEDISSGVFDQIMGQVQYEKSLGRLEGMSDMDAYITIVRANAQMNGTQPPVEEKAQTPSKERRKAAGINKRPPATKNKKTYDFLNMSDEEFEKLTPQTGLY